MNWRSYQHNHLKSLKRQARGRHLPYFFTAAILLLGAVLLIVVEHTGRRHPVSVALPAAPAATALSGPKPAAQPAAALSAARPAGTEIRSGSPEGLPKNDITRWIEHVMNDYRVQYGAVVAINVKTCKPVAVVSRGGGFSAFHAYPAASLIKLVTAAAAIEMHHVPPYALFYYDSRNASQSIRALTNRYNDGKKQITFSMALAKSNNPVFGKIALYKIGDDNLQEYFDRFYFNRSLGPHFIQESRAVVDNDSIAIAQTGAGLNPDTTISPFHAALIAQAIGNKGSMCVPYKGFGRSRQKTVRIMQPRTAQELIDMMKLTVTRGTSRRAFYNRRGRYILSNITVAGKTGSINGTDPAGDYEWFIGVAPVEDPQLAVAVLVVNGEKWTVKGSYLGAQTFLAYFFPDAVKKLLRAQ